MKNIFIIFLFFTTVSFSWIEYSPPKANFKIEFPGEPTVKMESVPENDIYTNKYTYFSEEEYAKYEMQVSSFMFNIQIDYGADEFFRLLETDIRSRNVGEITHEQKLKVDNYQAKEYIIKKTVDNIEMFIAYRFVITKTNLYTLIFTIPKNENSENKKSKFFDSLEFKS